MRLSDPWVIDHDSVCGRESVEKQISTPEVGFWLKTIRGVRWRSNPPLSGLKDAARAPLGGCGIARADFLS